jgi:signal transduction histidine kinase
LPKDRPNVTCSFVLKSSWLILCLLLGALPFLGRLKGEDLPAQRALTNISEIRDLRQTQAADSMPVKIEGMVLFYDFCPSPESSYHILFIHDGTAGIYVDVESEGSSLNLLPGQRIEVRGQSMPGAFAPIIKCGRPVKLGMDVPPGERSASMRDVLSGREDCNWVTVTGTVRQDAVVEDRREMVLDVDGRRLSIYFAGPLKSLSHPGGLVGARIAVRGVVSGMFNEDGQILGVRLFSPGPDYIRIINPPAPEIFALPLCGYAELRTAASSEQAGKPVKVMGNVTYDRPGYALCLSDGKQGLMVKSRQPDRVAIGEVVEAVGFPEQGNHSVFLEDGLFRQSVPGSLPEVTDVSAEGASTGAHDAELVRIRARLADQKLVNNEQVLLLQSGDSFFAARLPSDAGKFDSELHAGDTLQLTGICSREDLLSNFDKPGRQLFAFQLLLRSPQDVTVVQWWTNQRIFTLLSTVIAVFGLTFFWIAVLRRRVRKQRTIIEDQVRHAATLEERNRIARELHDTLAQGFAGTAFVLEGIATNLQDSDRRLKPHIDMALRMVRHGITEARLSLTNLRVDVLENRDLVTALQETARDLVGQSDVVLHTDIHPPAESLPSNIEANLLRISVEAMTNSLRHAKPRTMEISLRSAEGVSTLRIRDDGLGFDPESVRLNTGHFGLLGMRERARQMQATLSIVSSPGTGTDVCLTLDSQKTENNVPRPRSVTNC